jgi:TorA maturation chaperone TorD
LTLSNPKGNDALTMMKQAMLELPAPLDQAELDTLAADFASIYLTYGYRASPYESVWRDEEQLERQVPMFEIGALYRQHGLVVANRQTMPDDHISLQLEFIAYLCEHAASEADLQAAADFMDQHLLLWIEDFAHCIAARCETLFYAGLVALTASYVDTLRDCLAHITGQPRPDLTALEAEKPAVPEVPLKFMPGIAPSW